MVKSTQDSFLDLLREQEVPVAVYLVNGIKLQGRIDSHDNYVIMLKNSVVQMLYKHAVSTVVPAQNVEI